MPDYAGFVGMDTIQVARRSNRDDWFRVPTPVDAIGADRHPVLGMTSIKPAEELDPLVQSTVPQHVLSAGKDAVPTIQ